VLSDDRGFAADLSRSGKPPRGGSRTPHDPHPWLVRHHGNRLGYRPAAKSALDHRGYRLIRVWAVGILREIPPGHSRSIRGCGRGASKRRAWQKVIACVVGSSPEQSVEAPVVGVDRDNLYLAEAGLKGVLTKHRGSHDRRSLRSAGRPWRRAGRRPSSSRRQIGPVLRPHQAGPDEARGGARSPGSRCRPK
jgi:hypothetical protein